MNLAEKLALLKYTHKSRIYRLAVSDLTHTTTATAPAEEEKRKGIYTSPTKRATRIINDKIHEDRNLKEQQIRLPTTEDILPKTLIGKKVDRPGSMSTASIIMRGGKPIFVKRIKDTHLIGSNGERELANEQVARQLSHFFLKTPLSMANILRSHEDPTDRTKNYKIFYAQALKGSRPLGYKDKLLEDYLFKKGKSYNEVENIKNNIILNRLKDVPPEEIAHIALFNHFINAGDRHANNYRVTKNKLHPIDFGFSFHPNTKLEEIYWPKIDPVKDIYLKQKHIQELPVGKEFIKKALDNREEIEKLIKEKLLKHYSPEAQRAILEHTNKQFEILEKLLKIPNLKIRHINDTIQGIEPTQKQQETAVYKAKKT